MKILVPIDFSACSLNALEYAIRLASKIRATIDVLHVPLFESGVGESLASFSRAIQERVKEKENKLNNEIDRVLNKVAKNTENVPQVAGSIKVGKIGYSIIEAAKELEVDFIVMGTHGAKSTLDEYLGTLSSFIVKTAPCSVMVVPKSAEFSMVLTMGIATDLVKGEPSEIMNVVTLLQAFNPILKYVHFSDKPDKNLDETKKLREYIKNQSSELTIEFYNLPVKNSVESMNYFIEDQHINMLVMYKPERTFFVSIFHKSYTQTMAKHIKIPLLVLKEKS